MNTIRETVAMLRRWWRLRTGPLDQRLIAQANEEINDPEWWTRRPLALCVHPLRQNAFNPKMIAVSELMDQDIELLFRRESVKDQWGGRWTGEA